MPSTATHEQVLIKLLQKIDPYYFQEKFSLTQTYDYELILKCMIDYYNDIIPQIHRHEPNITHIIGPTAVN